MKKDGGYIGYFGLEEWYYSLDKDVQNKIVDHYSGFPGSKEMLLDGAIYSTGGTAVQLLTNVARAAASSKDHVLSDMLMKKAWESIITIEDAEYYSYLKIIISEIKQYMPDQHDIDCYKGKVLELINSQPGILQKDIKKSFPIENAAVVGHALSQLKYENKIERIKKGTSFKLYAVSAG